MDTRKNICLPNGWTLTPKHFANCQTMGVVYLLRCGCGYYYIVKTIQKLWQRIYRHILAMQTNDPDLPLRRHVAQVHDGHFPKVRILVLGQVHSSSRGGDFNKLLLQRELRWISDLNTTLPPGLNEVFNFKPFLPGFSSGGFKRDVTQGTFVSLVTCLSRP